MVKVYIVIVPHKTFLLPCQPKHFFFNGETQEFYLDRSGWEPSGGGHDNALCALWICSAVDEGM